MFLFTWVEVISWTNFRPHWIAPIDSDKCQKGKVPKKEKTKEKKTKKEKKQKKKKKKEKPDQLYKELLEDFGLGPDDPQDTESSASSSSSSSAQMQQ